VARAQRVSGKWEGAAHQQCTPAIMLRKLKGPLPAQLGYEAS
jgi:hypothetical protein